MSRLIINSIQIELEPSKPIARTLQVNDIASLNNRQANFTPTFSIPRTAKNVKAFAQLGVVGTNSTIPYQRNEAYYYAENGECLIYKGWAIITATENDFKCNLYDGAIDFYKAIENDSLSNLQLDEINHVKTLDNVVDSINGLTTYKYIFADYNGKALYDTNKINIDYLVPSVPVSYLWDKIFEYYGFTYDGTIFDTFAFQNFYMTFPKGVGSTIPDVEKFSSSEISIISDGSFFGSRSRYLNFSSFTIEPELNLISDRHILFNENALYRLEISGDIKVNTSINNLVWFRLAYNQQGNVYSSQITAFQTLDAFASNQTHSININMLMTIEELNSLCFFVKCRDFDISSVTNSLDIRISKVESQSIDFSGAFLDFKTKDFFNEVLTRFSLTPFKDKYSNNITFKTLYEILQDTDVIDWSDKFDSVISETYAYGSYAQKNDFTYKYNDNESDYYNGSININNENLEDSKTVINSKIYAPEKIKSNVLPKETNVYKLWDKEVKDDGSVTYKSLDKRFYFMRADNYIFETPVTIGSEALIEETIISQAPFESFFKLPFNDVVNDYYLPIYQILNQAKIVNANIFLKEQDIININFSKLYWIEALGNYFLLNKIINFDGNGITKVELIKVDYIPIAREIPFEIEIRKFRDGKLYFSPNYSTSINIQTSTDFGDTWTDNIRSGTSPQIGFTITEDTIFRIKNPLTDLVISNNFTVFA